jgi:hypothetical protein
MEGMNESYSHSSFFIATVPAEQRLSYFSHPKISLGFEFLLKIQTLEFCVCNQEINVAILIK